MTTTLGSRTTLLARFPADLNLPEGQPGLVEDAARAVRREYRSSVRFKRLQCRKVDRLSERPTDSIFILEVGHSIELDWTWEGAVAFRPEEPGKFTGEITDALVESPPGGAHGRYGLWNGEVVHVDEPGGRLFVSVSNPDRPPCRGAFYLRPFEFLAFLHSLFCLPGDGDLKRLLASRLNASGGGVHPPAVGGVRSGLKVFEEMWGHSWAILWGPPGCGKTTMLGRQVTACLGDAERILVVSTTNKATDAAALAIGRAARVASPSSAEAGRILRIGKGADHDAYEAEGFLGLLRSTETELLRQVSSLTRDLERAERHEERAVLRCQIQDLRRTMKDSAFNIFVSPDVSAVVATAFKAVALLSDPAIRSMAAAGEAPFTTLIIDEAGQMSRSVVAGMSLLASRRVVVVGDAKQLAPISKVSRVLPTSQAAWLASSCLTHLQRFEQVRSGVHMLREQHRMHPQVSRVVSHYQYEGALVDAPGVSTRRSVLPPLLAGQPRAIWYVFDEDVKDKELPAIRAERGPGNISWARPATRKVLEKLFSDPEVCKAKGLFITPFKAQARDIAGYFAEKRLDSWSAGTVHSRQGTEADLVIFDTVNAGSCGWSYDDWKRLVNVGLSRAREFVLLLASRAEMDEPYLRPLLKTLAPRVLSRSGRTWVWREVPGLIIVPPPHPLIAGNPDLLGNQIAKRKSLRPVMSAEQQRLCGYSMDGKPRLVRGVAGSGKTYVLAHWLQKTVRELLDKPTAQVWAVFANKALQRLIADTIEEAWKAEGTSGAFPWERVNLRHIRHILASMLPHVGVNVSPEDDFNYDAQAAQYLERKPFGQIEPCCQAMFIDEAQDMGPSTLKLLSGLVEQTDPDDPKSRAVNIFYDNAQNIYGRKKPQLSEIGLNMQGRSTVMKESFRSTRPITEFALNVLYRLQPPPGNDPDHKELVDRGLIEASTRNGAPWWNVRFCRVEGPTPIFRKYPRHQMQLDAIGDQVVRWIRDEGVKPCDIAILCNDKPFKEQVEESVGPKLQQINARLVSDPGQGWARDENAVMVSTSHSFKGYEAEIVVVGGAERFIATREILPNNLYVAMTRARSVLAIYAYEHPRPRPEAVTILSTLEQCLNALLDRPEVEREISNLDDFEEVLRRIGADPGKRDWLEKLWKSYLIQQEPLSAEDGEILAEPLFWFQVDDRQVACFGNEAPGNFILDKLEDAGIEVIQPGQAPPGK